MIFKNYISPYFKDKNMEEITPMHIRKWQNKILESKISKLYFQKIQKELSAIFNFTYKYYDLKENPVRKAGIVNDSPLFNSSSEKNIWNDKEFSIFINEIQNKEAKVIFYILFYTGMRIGEVLALNRNDIDYENLVSPLYISFIEFFICSLSSIERLYLSKSCSSILLISLDHSISDVPVKSCIGTNL